MLLTKGVSKMTKEKKKRQRQPKSDFQKDLDKVRKLTPRHVLEVELDVPLPLQPKLLNMMNQLRMIRNTTIGVAKKRYDQMVRTKRYKHFKKEMKIVLNELKKDNLKRKELNELNKRKREINESLKSLKQEFEVDEVSICDYGAKLNKERFKKVDAITVLSVCEHINEAMDKLEYGNANNIRFLPYGEFVPLQGKQANRSIILKRDKIETKDEEEKYSEPYMVHQKMKFPLKIKSTDLFVKETLSNIFYYDENESEINRQLISDYKNQIKLRDTYRICNNRIVCKEIRGKCRFFVQMTLEGNPVSKRKKDGSFRHVLGLGRIGLDIGTQSIAYVTDSNVELKNLAERSVKSTFKHEQQIIRLQRKMDRSKRAMNPQYFNEDGTIKKGKKEWVYSNRYKKVRTKYRELHRKNAINRRLANLEEINKLRTLGDEVILEPMNFKGLQKKAKEVTKNKKGRFNRRKRFGKSLLKRCPGTFIADLKKRFKQTDGNVFEVAQWDFKASQFDHMTGEYSKKTLSQRFHTFEDGTKVQRDLYSAFLLKCPNEQFEAPNLEECFNFYKQFKIQHDLKIKEIQEKKLKVLNSGIKLTA